MGPGTHVEGANPIKGPVLTQVPAHGLSPADGRLTHTGPELTTQRIQPATAHTGTHASSPDLNLLE